MKRCRSGATAARGEIPTKIYRFDLATGQRAVWREISVADRSGVELDPIVALTPDGKTCAYTVVRTLSDLYLVDGLK